jgi:hypothetical protein
MVISVRIGSRDGSDSIWRSFTGRPSDRGRKGDGRRKTAIVDSLETSGQSGAAARGSRRERRIDAASASGDRGGRQPGSGLEGILIASPDANLRPGYQRTGTSAAALVLQSRHFPG